MYILIYPKLRGNKMDRICGECRYWEWMGDDNWGECDNIDSYRYCEETREFDNCNSFREK